MATTLGIKKKVSEELTALAGGSSPKQEAAQKPEGYKPEAYTPEPTKSYASYDGVTGKTADHSIGGASAALTNLAHSAMGVKDKVLDKDTTLSHILNPVTEIKGSRQVARTADPVNYQQQAIEQLQNLTRVQDGSPASRSDMSVIGDNLPGLASMYPNPNQALNAQTHPYFNQQAPSDNTVLQQPSDTVAQLMELARQQDMSAWARQTQADANNFVQNWAGYKTAAERLNIPKQESLRLADSIAEAERAVNPMGLSDVEQSKQANILRRAEEIADEYPAVSSLLSIPMSVARPATFVNQINDYMHGRKIDSSAEYNIPNRVQNTLRETVMSKLGDVGRFFYGVGMSTGDFLINMAMGSAYGIGAEGLAEAAKLGEAISLGTMGMGAAGQSVQEAKDKGLDDDRAFVLGIIAGGIEILTEKVSLDKLLDADLLSDGALKYLLYNSITEGSEEGASDILNWIAETAYDWLSGQRNGDVLSTYDAYKSAGMNTADATMATLHDLFGQLGDDMLAGAVSGAFMAGSTAATYAAQNYRTGSELNRGLTSDERIEMQNELVDTGREFDPGTAARELADRASRKNYNRGNMSNYETGRQYNANVEAQRQQAEAEFADAERTAEDAAIDELNEMLRAQGVPEDQLVQKPSTQEEAYAQEAAEALGVETEAEDNATMPESEFASPESASETVSAENLTPEESNRVEEAYNASEARNGLLNEAAENSFNDITEALKASFPVVDSGIKALRSFYEAGQDAAAYANEFGIVYNQAALGQDIPEAYYLTPVQRQAAINAALNDVAAAQAAEMEAVNEQGLSVSRSGERSDGTRTEGQGRAVAESTGQTQSAGRDIRSAAKDTGYDQTKRGKAVSTYELTGGDLGVSGTTEQLYEITGNLSEDMQKAADVAGERGLKIKFFGGGPLVGDGFRARGAIVGDTVYVRADDPYHLSSEIAGHEIMHDMIDDGEVFSNDVLTNLTDVLSEADYNDLVSLYREAYRGTGMSEREIMDELVCDLNGRMNAFAYLQDRNVDALFERAAEAGGRAIDEARDQAARDMEYDHNANAPPEKFSLELPVEETADLIALHNLSASKLAKTLDLGGFPMPSIAVTKANIPHTNFGDITLVMDKTTIDPQFDRRNTVYSADAWTPTFPEVEYETNSKVERKISDKYYQLAGKFGYDSSAVRSLYRYVSEPETMLSRYDGEEGVIRELLNDTDMMNAFLADTTGEMVEPVQNTTTTQMDPEAVAEGESVMNSLGDEKLLEFENLRFQKRRAWISDNEDAIKTAYGEFLRNRYSFSDEEIENVLAAQKAIDLYRIVKASVDVMNGNTSTTTTETDVEGTRNAIRKATNKKDYGAWLHGLFDGLVQSTGIYNQRERFTRSGNRRSFSQTHYPVTLENIAKAMAAQNDGNSRNVSGFYGVKSLRAGTAKRFSSIAEMHELEGRLRHLSEEEAGKISNALSDRLSDISQRIYDTAKHSRDDNSFIAFDQIGNILMEAAQQKTITVDSVIKAFNGTSYKVGNALAADIRDLLFDISQMPVNIYEAKPERAVRFDEVLAAVVPSDTDQALIKRLSDQNVRVLSYEAGNNEDRLTKVNSVDGAKFSRDFNAENGQKNTKGQSASPLSGSSTSSRTAEGEIASVDSTLESTEPEIPAEKRLDIGVNILELDNNVKHAMAVFSDIFDVVVNKKKNYTVDGSNYAGTLLAEYLVPILLKHKIMMRGSRSSAYYEGNGRTLRLSNHYSNVTYFKNDNNNISITIFNEKPGNVFAYDDSKNLTELYFSADYLNRHSDTFGNLIHDIAKYIVDGVYSDTAGPLNYHFSGSKEYKRGMMNRLLADANNRAYDGSSIKILRAAQREGIQLNKHEVAKAEKAREEFNAKRAKTKTSRVLPMQEALQDDAALREARAELQAVRGELEETVSKLNKAKANMYFSKPGTPDPETVRKYARKLGRSWNVEKDFEYDKLEAMISKAQKAAWSNASDAEIESATDDIARMIVDNMRPDVEDPYDGMYREIRSQLKRTEIKITREQARDIPDFNDFRKQAFGYANIKYADQGNIDQVYNDLRSRYEWLFPDDNLTASDQLIAIDEVMHELQPKAADHMSTYQRGLFVEHIGETIRADLLGDQINELRTRADRIRADAEFRTAEKYTHRMTQLYTNMDNTMENLRSRNESLRDLVASVRESRDARLQEMRDHYEQVRKNARARRLESEARQKLLKIARRMEKMRTTNANRALIDSLISDLDTIAVSMTGAKATQLTELRQWYIAQAENDPDNFIRDPRIERQLERLEKKQIKSMDIGDVISLTEALRNIEVQIRNANHLISEEERRDVNHLGQIVIRDIESSRGSGGSKFDQMIIQGALSPERLLHRTVGYEDSDPLYKAGKALSDGQRKMLDFQIKAEDRFAKWEQDKKFMNRIRGKHAQFISVTGQVEGKEVQVRITPAMRISLYLAMQNDDNLRHIAYGGVRIPDEKLYKADQMQKAYDQMQQGRPVQFTPGQLRRIAAGMPLDEKQFADAMASYFNGDSQAAINEVSEQLVGYSIAQVEHYFPIQTDGKFRATAETNIKMDGTIEGWGALKERINAKNPIMLYDATQVVRSSIDQTSKYVGLAIPIRNFNKLMGVTSRSFDEDGMPNGYRSSVQNAIASKWGSKTNRYIDDMLIQLQNPKPNTGMLSEFLRKVRSNYAGAVLTLNMSVALKQAASYPTAIAVLGTKPVARAMGNIGKVDLDLIKKYTPLQAYRTKGYADTERGDLARDNKRLPKALNWIQMMDAVTTRKLWKASEYYVRENYKDLDVGSDGYYREVANWYNRVIEETQPNYTIMQRPELLRSSDSLTQSLMMFKTQPFQNFNILYDAYGNLAAKRAAYKADKSEANKAKLSEARKQAFNATVSQVIQLAVFAGMTASWGLLRGKDKDYENEEGEVTFGSFMNRLGFDMLSGAAAMLPFGSELFEWFTALGPDATYYGFDEAVTSFMNDVLKEGTNSINAVGDFLQAHFDRSEGDDVDYDASATFHQLRRSAEKILAMTAGLPAENVEKLFDMIAYNVSKMTNGKYAADYTQLRLTTPISKTAGYYNVLYDAYRHDRASYEAIYAAMIRDGFDETKMINAMKRKTADDGSERRFVRPDKEQEYNDAADALESSEVWQSASDAVRESAMKELYNLVAGTGDSAAEKQAKVEGYASGGISQEQYLEYYVSLRNADASGDGNGSFNKDEKEAAIRSMEGLTDQQRSYMWENVAGLSAKTNPFVEEEPEPVEDSPADEAPAEITGSYLASMADAEMIRNASISMSYATSGSQSDSRALEYEKARDHGLSTDEYAAYLLALEINDSADGNSGKHNQADKIQALNMVRGWTNEDKSWFWRNVLGYSPKTDPYA